MWDRLSSWLCKSEFSFLVYCNCSFISSTCACTKQQNMLKFDSLVWVHAETFCYFSENNYDISIYNFITNVPYNYCKRRKFWGVKLSWFFNCCSEVKFHGFRGSLVYYSWSTCNGASLIPKVLCPLEKLKLQSLNKTSLVWPDLSPQGAYQLEIISARSETKTRLDYSLTQLADNWTSLHVVQKF